MPTSQKTMIAVLTAALAICPGTARSQIETPRIIMPMMKIVTPGREAESKGRPDTAAFDAIDGYTRLYVEFSDDEPGRPATGARRPDEEVRFYEEQKRNWLRRRFAGKAIARLLSIKTSLARPSVSTTTVLTSLGYSSNGRSGESWTSDLNPRRVLTPLFRIDADSTISIEATTSATSTYNVSAVGGALDIVRRAAALATPAAPLVTSLNQQRFDAAAAFVDQSISSLLQESITERATNEFPMKSWAGRPLAAIHLWMPTGNEITPARTGVKRPEEMRYVGTWTIRAEPALLSVFADTGLVHISRTPQVGAPAAATDEEGEDDADAAGTTSLCRAVATTGSDDQATDRGAAQAACAVFARLDPQTVLNFPVNDGVPLVQSLSGDSGIAAARERLIKESDNDRGAGNAYAVCALVADKAHRLGFNRMDTAAILWAYISQTFVTEGTDTHLRNPRNCPPLQVAYAFGLPQSGYQRPGTPPKVDVQAVPAPPPPEPPTTGTGTPSTAPIAPSTAAPPGGVTGG